jgi:hypothetical protein
MTTIAPWLQSLGHALERGRAMPWRAATLACAAIGATSLAAVAFIGPARASSPETPPVPGCQSHVHLFSAAAYAKALGQPEAWVAENHRIDVWSSLTLDRTRAGQMAPGEYARVLSEDEDGYEVVTAAGVQGWVSRFQVSRTGRRDADTGSPCH